MGGGHIPYNPTIDIDPGWAVQGNLAGRIADFPFLDVYVEVPVIATFNLDVPIRCIPEATSCPGKYSALFVTPGLKVKFAPSFPISPYLVAGGGIARLKAEDIAGTDETRTTGAFNFGGGLDFRAAPFVSLRAEVRDMYSGGPRFRAADFTDSGHNLLVTGGIVFRF